MRRSPTFTTAALVYILYCIRSMFICIILYVKTLSIYAYFLYLYSYLIFFFFFLTISQFILWSLIQFSNDNWLQVYIKDTYMYVCIVKICIICNQTPVVVNVRLSIFSIMSSYIKQNKQPLYNFTTSPYGVHISIYIKIQSYPNKL